MAEASDYSPSPSALFRKGAAGRAVCVVHAEGNDQFALSGEGVLIELMQAPSEVTAALG